MKCHHEENADLVGTINIHSIGLMQFEELCEGLDTVDASTWRCSSSVAQIACEVSGEVMPTAAGTHRSDLVEVD